MSAFEVRRIAVVVLVSVLTSSLAMGALLVPGGTLAPAAGAAPGGANNVFSSGALSFQSQDFPLNPNGTSFTGTLTTDVWTNYPGNPFTIGTPGALTFTYLLHNNGPDPLHRLVTTDFTGYNVDVQVNGDSPGVSPDSIDRDVSGKIVGWNFDAPPRLPAGSNSFLMIIHTSATRHVPALASVIDGATAPILSQGPALFVPEPAALGALAIAGSALLVGRRRSGFATRV